MENSNQKAEKQRIWRSIIIAAIAGLLAAGIVMYQNHNKNAQPTFKQQLQEKKTQDSLAR
jgi:predicted histidine transporter YuiF (NhaC family)